MTPCLLCPPPAPGRPPRFPSAGLVCDGCRKALSTVLADIDSMVPLLPENLVPSRGGGLRVSGGEVDAPMPLAADVFDLMQPYRSIQLTTHGKAALKDQIGELPVSNVLGTWCEDWRVTRDRGELGPGNSSSGMLQWLRVRLDWACDEHPAVDEFDTEMRVLRGALSRVTGGGTARPVHLDVPCRECQKMTLFRPPGDDRAYCQDEDCRLILTREEYDRWVALLAGYHRVAG